MVLVKTVKNFGSLSIFLLSLSACNIDSVKPDTPAIIVDPTPESREELLRVVSWALNDAEVLLADDALTHGNTLIIERKLIKDAEGNLAQGRELGMLERFQLFIDDGACILEHQNGGERWQLKHTACKAVK